MFEKIEKVIIYLILPFIFTSCAEEQNKHEAKKNKEFIKYNLKTCSARVGAQGDLDIKDSKYVLRFYEGNSQKEKELNTASFNNEILAELDKIREIPNPKLSREVCVEIDKQLGSSFSYPPRNFWTDFSSEKGLEVNNKFKGLGEIPNKEKIVNLSLEDSSITSLDSIESFKNLKVIFLFNSKIKDLSPLELIKDREIFVLYNPKEITIPKNSFHIYVDMTDYKCSVWNYANYQFGYYHGEEFKPNSPEKIVRVYNDRGVITYYYEDGDTEAHQCDRNKSRFKPKI